MTDPRDAQIATLRDALENAARWFQEFADGYTKKYFHVLCRHRAEQLRAALAAAPLPAETAWQGVVAARKRHIEAVADYNAKRGELYDSSGNYLFGTATPARREALDAAFAAMDEAQRDFIRAAQSAADAALAAAPLPAKTEPPDYRAQNLGCPCNNYGLSRYCKDVGPCAAFGGGSPMPPPAPTTEPRE